MKKASALLATMVLLAALVGCGGGASSSEPTAAPADAAPASEIAAEPESAPEENHEPEETPDEPAEEPAPTGDPLAEYEAILKANAVDYEKAITAGELVGALEGARFTIGEVRVELYVFDKDSDAWAETVANNQIYLDGIGGFSCYVNESAGAALTIEGDEGEYLQWFEGL